VHLLLVMFGTVARGDLSRALKIEFLAGGGGVLAVSQSEGLDPVRSKLGSKGRGKAAVDTAGEEKTDRHVGHHPPTDGDLETPGQLFGQLLFLERFGERGPIELPV